MRAMDYISSTDICYLTCDTLSLIDERPIAHGMRVAYMMMKMLECKGGYDEYEIAEFVFLSMIHDIGVYRTNKITDELGYDTGASGTPHAVYGALFLKQVSPFGARSDILMYHHLPYSKVSRINYGYSKIAMYLYLLEEADALYRKHGAELDPRVFEEGSGSSYLPEAVVLLVRCIRQENMLARLATGEYKREMRAFMENILFTNEEKENYIRFIMHCFSFKGRMRTLEAIMCSCIVDEIAQNMELSGREKDKLYYASMLHDIGLLAIDPEIIKGTKKFTEEERTVYRKHVEIGKELLGKYFLVQDIADIAATHHELLDGSGYPDGLKENQISDNQAILQVADNVTAVLNMKRKLSRTEIISILQVQAQRKRLLKKAVSGVTDNYDTINNRLRTETQEYLEMHVRINNRYKRLVGGSSGEEE